MTDRELKKLKRNELLEMLIAQIEENERLKHRMEEQKRQLQDRQIAVEQAGSIAEAALKLNGVFEAAQSAAFSYYGCGGTRSEKESDSSKRIAEFGTAKVGSAQRTI